MATPTIVGVGGSGNLPQTNELKVDIWKKRMTAFPELTPITTITSRLAVDPAHNFQIELLEENAMPSKVTIAQDEASASTTIYVSAYGTTLVQDTLLYNPRVHDLRLVDSTPTTNTVTVSVDQGGTTSSVWKSGDEVFVLPPALAENDENFRAASAQDTRVYNYMQLIKMQYAITRLNDKLHTQFGGAGEKRRALKRQKYREFREKGELLRYFGGRASSGTAPASKRMQGGLVHFLRSGTLYKDYGGTFTESGWDNLLGDYRDQNPDARNIAACVAPNVLRQINYFAKDKIRISPNTKKYGLNLTQYQGGPMTVDLIELPLLTDATTRGWGFLLDFSRIKLQDVDKPMFHPDAKDIGESEIIYDTYREVTSMLVANESRHAMFVGATL